MAGTEVLENWKPAQTCETGVANGRQPQSAELQILKFFAANIERHIALTFAVNLQRNIDFCYGSVCRYTFRRSLRSSS